METFAETSFLSISTQALADQSSMVLHVTDVLSIRSRDSIGSLNTAIPRLRRQQQGSNCL